MTTTIASVRFDSLGLAPNILRAVAEQNYEEATPVQAAAIPELLAGYDLLATAQTGTGKTAAFALPILQRLGERTSTERRGPRALVLSPTRELALQIDESFRAYGRHTGLRTAAVLGGVSMHMQIRALQRFPEIVIATPGRLIDLMGQGAVRLDAVEMLVLDEADRMLDMGFLPAIRRIAAKLPTKRQTMLFSATMPPEIADLAATLLDKPVHIAISPPSTVAHNIEQQVYFVEQGNKRPLLIGMLHHIDFQRALIFTRTKHMADRVSEQLSKAGIDSEAIHSNRSQAQRQRALASFERGKVRVLVATDIVARGIDVEGITHVINYELPDEPESYIHRIGRTARAGASGTAVSFCSAHEVRLLRGIERLTKSRLTHDLNHVYHCTHSHGLYGLGSLDGPTLPARSYSPRGRSGRRAGSGRR